MWYYRVNSATHTVIAQAPPSRDSEEGWFPVDKTKYGTMSKHQEKLRKAQRMAMNPDRDHMTLTLPTVLILRLREMARERNTTPAVMLRALLPTLLDRLEDEKNPDNALFGDLIVAETTAESERRSKAGKKGMATRWGDKKGSGKS